MQTAGRKQRIAVTGATEEPDRTSSEIPQQRGHDVVPISRSKGVDVVGGEPAPLLFAGRGDSVEVREERESMLAPRANDPDSAAYAEGAVLPTRARKLPAPASKSGSPAA